MNTADFARILLNRIGKLPGQLGLATPENLLYPVQLSEVASGKEEILNKEIPRGLVDKV